MTMSATRCLPSSTLFVSAMAGVVSWISTGTPVPCLENDASAATRSLATVLSFLPMRPRHLMTICTFIGAPGTSVSHVPPGGSVTCNAIVPDTIGVPVSGALGRPTQPSSVPVTVHFVVFGAGVVASPFAIFTTPLFFGSFGGRGRPAPMPHEITGSVVVVGDVVVVVLVVDVRVDDDDEVEEDVVDEVELEEEVEDEVELDVEVVSEVEVDDDDDDEELEEDDVDEVELDDEVVDDVLVVVVDATVTSTTRTTVLMPS